MRPNCQSTNSNWTCADDSFSLFLGYFTFECSGYLLMDNKNKNHFGRFFKDLAKTALFPLLF